jgi:hypothetical protein
MTLKITDTNRLPDLMDAISELKSFHVEVGIFGQGTSKDAQNKQHENDSFILMIAKVHEFGMEIKPKNGRFLTIPLNKKAREHYPGYFDDLFTLKADSGELFLVREKGKDQLEFMYWLAKSVTIPERSYIRTGYDESQPQLEKLIDQLVQKVLNLEMTPKVMYERIGLWVVSKIQDKIRSIKDPANSNVTVTNKGSSNPLIDSGRLIQSITYRVVKV